MSDDLSNNNAERNRPEWQALGVGLSFAAKRLMALSLMLEVKFGIGTLHLQRAYWPS